jgi:hypothetical protein
MSLTAQIASDQVLHLNVLRTPSTTSRPLCTSWFVVDRWRESPSYRRSSSGLPTSKNVQKMLCVSVFPRVSTTSNMLCDAWPVSSTRWESGRYRISVGKTPSTVQCSGKMLYQSLLVTPFHHFSALCTTWLLTGDGSHLTTEHSPMVQRIQTTRFSHESCRLPQSTQSWPYRK